MRYNDTVSADKTTLFLREWRERYIFSSYGEAAVLCTIKAICYAHVACIIRDDVVVEYT